MAVVAFTHVAVQCAVCLLLPAMALYVGYQLILSPLRKYPGPIIGKFSDAYAGWHAIKKDLHVTTYNDHFKYGPIVRQGPNRLVFNTVQALHDIYTNPHVGKGASYAKSRLKNVPNIHNTLDKTEHRRKRKIVGRTLSEMAMREFEPSLTQQVDIFLNQILKSKGKVIDMTPVCQRLGIDIIGRLAFGYPWNTQVEEPLRFIPESMASITSRLNLFIQWPFSHILDGGGRWVFRKSIERYRQHQRQMIEYRIRQPAINVMQYDLFSGFADEGWSVKTTPKEIMGSELWAEVGIFLTAGGSTTATLMAATFFYLSQNRGAYTKLATEIRSTYTSGKEICLGATLNGCQYLRAVLDESLRMSPPTAGPMWRQQDEFLSTEPFIVDGQVIEPGTVVSVCLYSIHHNAEYFKQPFSYNPDRWLKSTNDGPENEEARAIMRRAFAPFALGDRSCAGKALAYSEASMAIAKAIFYFDFKMAAGETGRLGGGKEGAPGPRGVPQEFQLHDVFTSDHKGPNIVFEPRGEHWKELVGVA